MTWLHWGCIQTLKTEEAKRWLEYQLLMWKRGGGEQEGLNNTYLMKLAKMPFSSGDTVAQSSHTSNVLLHCKEACLLSACLLVISAVCCLHFLHAENTLPPNSNPVLSTRRTPTFRWARESSKKCLETWGSGPWPWFGGQHCIWKRENDYRKVGGKSSTHV